MQQSGKRAISGWTPLTWTRVSGFKDPVSTSPYGTKIFHILRIIKFRNIIEKVFLVYRRSQFCSQKRQKNAFKNINIVGTDLALYQFCCQGPHNILRREGTWICSPRHRGFSLHSGLMLSCLPFPGRQKITPLCFICLSGEHRSWLMMYVYLSPLSICLM
jgi:hypothetical protein